MRDKITGILAICAAFVVALAPALYGEAVKNGWQMAIGQLIVGVIYWSIVIALIWYGLGKLVKL